MQNEWILQHDFFKGAFHQTHGFREKLGHGGVMGVMGLGQNTSTTTIAFNPSKEQQEIFWIEKYIFRLDINLHIRMGLNQRSRALESSLPDTSKQS